MNSIQSEESDEYLQVKPVATANKRNESLAGVLFVDDDEGGYADSPNPRLPGVAEKRGTASTAETNASVSPTAPERLHQMEQEVLAKQKGRRQSHESSRMEQRVNSTPRVASKVRYAKSPSVKKSSSFASSEKEPQKEKENNITRHPSGPRGLEAAIQDKILKYNSPATPLKDRKSGTEKKVSAEQEISRLDERIAFQNGKVRLVSTSSLVPRSQEGAPIKRADSPPTVEKISDEGVVKLDGSVTMIEHLPKDKKNDKDDALQNSGLQHGLNTADHSGRGGLLDVDGDLEFGILDGREDKGLVVAFAVDDEGEDMFIPSAVEFDPDAKPSIYRNRRFRLYACLAIIVVVVGTITASVGITLTKSEEPEEPMADVPYRATLGIRESIERVVGSEKLDDLTSPYRKALDWIQDVDPLQAVPESPTFTQRYIAAYFYFATSVKKPWSDGCSPATNGEPDECVYKRLVSVDPVEYSEMPWTRWLSAKTECVWAGVFCDETGQIRALEFSGSNMTGAFPEGIVGFPFLQSIALTYNELEGALPDSLVEMKHLVNIELQGNLFTGTVPSAWYKSRSIQRINLSINQLSGSIDAEISTMRDLKGIYLHENMITGTLPTEIGLLRSMSYVQLNRNYIEGRIPSSFGNMQQVYDIWLQRNLLTGPIPNEIGLMKDLSDFRLQSNFLTGSIPEQIYDLPAIRRIDLYENQMNGTLSSSIGNLTLIDQFRINDNQFSGVLPTEMGLMTTLASFVASGNNFVGIVPEELCDLRLRDFGSYFVELQADCSVPRSGVAEISCPDGCCTYCCDANGTICVPTE